MDLSLEQTINADGANKLTGISYMTNSISARQRWCKSHSIKSSVVAFIMEEKGIRKHQDITADLKKNRIQQYFTQVHNFI